MGTRRTVGRVCAVGVYLGAESMHARGEGGSEVKGYQIRGGLRGGIEWWQFGAKVR